jgi:hypothetical protein
MIVVEDRKAIDTSTGEVIAEFDPRNSRPSLPEVRKNVCRTIIGGRTPQASDLPADYHQGPEPYWCPHSDDFWICRHCNYGIERTDGRRIKVATKAQRRAAQNRPDIDWHYVSPMIWFGRCPEGHDYALERGRVGRVYSLKQRQDALVLIVEYGLSAASRKTGIPRTTLKNWYTRGAQAA